MMLQTIPGSKKLEMGWGCASCHGRELMQVEEITNISDNEDLKFASIIPRPDIVVCAKCGTLYLTEILREKNT